MKYKYFLTVLCSILVAQATVAQSNKDWKTHLSYYEATAVAEVNDLVYVLANGALYSYNKNDREIRIYSKINGLSDTDVSLIKYSPDTHTLIIVYSNGNIDLLTGDAIKNMPYLKMATNIQSKKVNDILLHNHLAYFSTDFGVMVVNLNKK